MNIPRLLALSIPCLLVVAPLDARIPKSQRPTVCVLEFPVAAGAYEGWGGWGHGGGGETHIGSVLQELMTTAMMDEGTGKIRLIERKQLEAILGEQKLGASGLVDEATAVSMGKLKGVKYMITGKVTRFAYKKSGFATGWGVSQALGKIAPSIAGVAGDVHVSKASFTGRLDVRLIDVQTGEVLATASDEGTVKDTSVKVAGTGSDVQYDQELVNKIFEPVVKTISAKLIKKLTRVLDEEAD